MFSRVLQLSKLSYRQPCRGFSTGQLLCKPVEQFPMRTVPKLPTFYSANPHHEHRIDRLESLLRKYVKLPLQSISQQQLERPVWITLDDYALVGGGTRLKPIQYQQLLSLLNKLHAIDPQLTNDEIKQELSQYYRKSNMSATSAKLKTLDEFGRSIAIGRRKASVSKVQMVKGTGEIIVNGRSLNDYFVKLKDRESVAYPLQAVDSVGKYNIFITTSGGGPTGQAEASMHAIAKALLIFNPLLKPRLRKAGTLTRDYRHVERKKPGHKKSRKMPTWVKR
ncbi:ZYRO0B05962p [Zygosaccharomyces rouxii]|uniref:Small ribosomal subunit protein uS9m n=1 Tax=Zygosaccharomyces rouxii (strain ATCC 2623 / CBS 732 / NBRC 1130 / NCYC 568 / NRRL Y-229) TaxID=559307 RepID=C5DR67_ZYGRC|nr:mitochondrial 37S ribosomal protein MRPS9 [Zygosaccharomyces rouxii]KAH9200177.1 mitochondrial 37S ribosomal protein MRPS9 [Zygosaccharomyces rouxii]CAR26278.1 ZYRO0B05962p [Zygosaccharomyces rouxii]